MDYGLMLPYMVATNRSTLLGWARSAEESGYRTLTTGERIAYPNIEQMVALSAAAAVTERVRLLANVMIVPMHPVGLLAKRLASLDVLSEGRLAVAVGVGGREDDYAAAGSTMERRWQRAEAAVKDLRRLWRGDPLRDGDAPVGPSPWTPGGPELWCGSRGPKAMRRAARWGAVGYAGFTLDGSRENLEGQAESVDAAWREAGRRDRPRMFVSCFVALGPDARDHLGAAVRRYWPQQQQADIRAQLTVDCIDRVHEVIEHAAAAGFDELNFLPVVDDLEEFGRITEAIDTSTYPLGSSA